MDFGSMVEYLKGSPGVAKAARISWNGRGMWIALQVPDAHSKMTLPYLYMCTVDGDLVPWLASQTDVLAVDWTTVS